MFGKKKKQKVKLTGKFYNKWEHTGWGNAITIMDWEKGRIAGHLPVKPVVGDEIRFKLESGKVGRTMVVEVENCGDPPDMFFATLEEIGYLEGEPAPEPLTDPLGLRFM